MGTARKRALRVRHCGRARHDEVRRIASAEILTSGEPCQEPQGRKNRLLLAVRRPCQGNFRNGG